ncbi:NUDIX hydrolase [Streptomyces clavuligerus]|uniref:NTP pyrophosphohydrolase n=1 Tax=Streptomyces clavuligerus TaxID=1901 RepID=B5GMS2_STRCL|nr:NUDIX domain-containing protein [Streptomyces clavuligerus]ANW22462.1 NTP pyrophosphohydrolase [Streptomyces clavuligerus]AXU17366.1 NUDIX domain-containing protein [Streptomyces clavuligerus]EDY47618.1 NTP pyrophosphohydrolase [Streptomyces clavuligerus]EFG04575.1 NTP pyrophosphohydrolase [Streptomyces clavuligerus]MBY6306977.1 NUDIX domain-containing protein [Streptomyces clavuligerus]
MSELVERVDEQDRVLGVVDRAEAIRRKWPHRVATVLCRDPRGRVLVHRRPENAARFPGQYHWLLGGAVGVGESYAAAAGRELEEELGVRAPVRFLLTFLCDGVISPYWLGLYETVIDPDVTPDPAEVAWHAWIPESGLGEALERWCAVPDGLEVYRRYSALPAR